MIPMRPIPAAWFEALVAKDDAALALEALARSGAFELETRGHPALTLIEMSGPMQKFAELERRYHAYWPLAQALPAPGLRSPYVAASQAIEKLERWEATARPLVLRLQALAHERAELHWWTAACHALAGSRLDFGLLAQAGPWLAVRIMLLQRGEKLQAPAALLVRRFELDDQHGMLLLGPDAEMAQFCQQAAHLKVRLLNIPVWVHGTATTLRETIAARLAGIENETQQTRQQLEVQHQQHDLHHALGDLLRLQWFGNCAGVFPESDVFVWITGWCSDRTRLMHALEASGARAAAHFPPAPLSSEAPLLLRNPRWAQPFELFSKALGMPGRNEADPSQLLALIVPLLFGYMFGDVGQGLILIALGGYLQRRYAAARILIPCGVSATLFGLLFGSIFSLHGVIPALWLQPLDHPLSVLAVPLVAGALLLALGQLLHALQAFWQGQLRVWLSNEAGLLLLYGGAWAAWFLPRAGWLALGGAALYLLGHYRRTGKAMALLSGLGSLLENSLQLLTNTLSFARVGAFALAHAGLSLAVTTLAQASDTTASMWVLVLGNIVVIALEVLVVSVQTTRLMLFEFFIRFLRGEGRMFRPLPAPLYFLKGES